MTDKEKLEKVRAEIKRRRKLHEDSLINPIHEGFGLQNVIKAKISELTYLSSFIDSIQKEPKECMYSTANYTNADRLTLCKDCEELCKYNQKTAAESLGISQEAYDEIVDKCLYGSEVELVDDGDLPKEEPVSEDLEEASYRFACKCHPLKTMEIIDRKWQRNFEPAQNTIFRRLPIWI